MATHAQLAAQFLRDAADFFQSMGEQNQPLKEQMAQYADTFRTVAELVEKDPNGHIDI